MKIKFIKNYRLEQCNTITLEVMDMKTVSVRLNAEEERPLLLMLTLWANHSLLFLRD